MKKKWVLWRYFWNVRKYLPCCMKRQNEIFENMRTEMVRFMNQNPDADLTQLQNRFGQPEQIAAACLDELNQTEIINAVRLRKGILRIIAGAAAVVVLLLGAAAIYVVAENHRSNPAVVEIGIIEVCEGGKQP